MRFFLQFLLYTFLGSLTALALAGVRLAGCWRGWWHNPATAIGRATLAAAAAYARAIPGPRGRVSYVPTPSVCALPPMPDIIVLVVSCVLALFFAIFTAAMFWDQYEGGFFP